MSEELATTDGSVAPTDDSTELTTTPGGTTGAVVATDGSTDQGADLTAIIDGIPVDDNDLTDKTTPHYASLVQQRSQLRTLSSAVRDLQPLTAYKELGELDVIRPRLELANLLFSEAMDPKTGKPLTDENTGTTYITTMPFIAHLDQQSPGMPEQLLADLLPFKTEDAQGNMKPLSQHILDHWDQVDPTWWQRRYGISAAQLSPTFGAVSQAELDKIDPQYRDAYRLLTPSERAAWDSYEEADQMVMLRRMKSEIDSQAFISETKQKEQRREAYERAQYQTTLKTEQRKYTEIVRRERFTALSESLKQQVTYSTDPIANTIAHGEVMAVLANLIDPDLRFVAVETILTPLGLKLDHTFDEALKAFDANAEKAVALELSGDILRADDAQAKAKAAADQLVAKLSIIALKVAAKKGGTIKARAVASGVALANAATTRPMAGNGQTANGDLTGVLPEGMRPGTPEAAMWLANQTGFWKP